MFDWTVKRTKITDVNIKYNRGNNDSCSDKYRCASSLYLISVFSQCHSIIIDWGISAPGHVKEVVDGLNTIDKRYIYIYQLMSNVQLPG